MDLKTLTSAVMEVAEERGVSKDKVLEIIGSALGSAYKKEYGKKKEKYRAELDPETGETTFWKLKMVVRADMLISDEELEELKEKGESKPKDKVKFNPDTHIMLEEAKKVDKNAETGGHIEIPVETRKDFGRIAAQTAKQVILQRIKEAEKSAILDEYKQKEGEVVSGIVQRVESKAVYFDIGKTAGILPSSEQIKGESYTSGQRFKLYVTKVEENPRGPIIFLSRSYPKLVSKLFELEVPEISAGQVEIKSIAREAGSRTKIAVYSSEDEIDAVGAFVGQKGTRILAVMNELGGEKIDVIEWSENPEKYITNALSPAKILEIKILPKNTARATVASDQLSLAIGKDGENVRLAAKLTGWKIDVKSLKQMEEGEDKKEAAESIEASASPEDEENQEETEKDKEK